MVDDLDNDGECHYDSDSEGEIYGLPSPIYAKESEEQNEEDKDICFRKGKKCIEKDEI